MASDPPLGSGARPEPPDPLRRAHVSWPTPLQALRQIALIVVVVSAWGALFTAAMRLPGGGDDVRAEGSGRERGRRSALAADGGAGAGNGSPVATPGGSAEAAPADPDVRTAPAAAADPPAPDAPGPTRSEDPAPGVVSSSSAPLPAPPPSVGSVAPSSTTPSSPGSTATPSTAPPSAGSSVTSPEDGGARTSVDDDRPRAFDPLDTVAGPGDPATVSFARDVLPILERRCVKCHGGERPEGGIRLEEGLSLRTWADVMAGSTWGTVVEPGDPAASYLLELVQDGDMPNKEPRLLPRELRLLLRWIAAGAPDN